MIAILDFGSQYTQLIARRVRELNVYCEILPHDTPPEILRDKKVEGVILSGGPQSATENGHAPVLQPHAGVFTLGLPVLGICYGHQIMARLMGGKVKKAPKREYGLAKIGLERSEGLFDGINPKFNVWMSHGDEVAEPPHGFVALGETDNAPYAAMAHPAKKFFGLQFHPEVQHTENGKKILENFLDICECKRDWKMKDWVETAVAEIRELVGKQKVLMAMSGGVDSSVVATLIHKAIGKQLLVVFVDTGLLLKGEADRVRRLFGKRFEDSLVILDESERFMKALKGVSDPEKKRKIIGGLFVDAFEEFSHQHKEVSFLAQGTLYPDIIESGKSVGGKAHVIKTHHNVGGLPEKLKLKLLEPVKELFKDEVRILGRELGLSEEIVMRHPFPGPGLAVRVMGEITEERVKMLQEAHVIFDEEIRQAGLYGKIWQAFAVATGAHSVGVTGDQRNYGEVIAIRAVDSVDGMTADWFRIPDEVLSVIARRIVNEIHGVSRVVYDITSKPPATIEWE